MKGKAKGAALFCFNHIFLTPVYDKIKSVVIPRIVAKIKRRFGEKWKSRFVNARRRFKHKFRDVNPFMVDLDKVWGGRLCTACCIQF